MSRVLRSVRKRKKGCTLGAVDVIDREGYTELEVDAKVELIRSLVPLGLLHIEELLDEEVTALVGERYARKDPSVGGRRHGSNPGTVGLTQQERRNHRTWRRRMNPRLKDYLQTCTPTTADQTMLDELRREMDKAVPEITESIRQREELAAELRLAVSRPSQSRKENQD